MRSSQILSRRHSCVTQAILQSLGASLTAEAKDAILKIKRDGGRSRRRSGGKAEPNERHWQCCCRAWSRDGAPTSPSWRPSYSTAAGRPTSPGKSDPFESERLGLRVLRWRADSQTRQPRPSGREQSLICHGGRRCGDREQRGDGRDDGAVVQGGGSGTLPARKAASEAAAREEGTSRTKRTSDESVDADKKAGVTDGDDAQRRELKKASRTSGTTTSATSSRCRSTATSTSCPGTRTPRRKSR